MEVFFTVSQRLVTISFAMSGIHVRFASTNDDNYCLLNKYYKVVTTEI